MLSAFLVVQVILGIALIVLILLQQGKGADMGAAFGSGSSGTVFGSQGAGNFMTRTTAIVATLFIVNSLVLSTNWMLGDREPSSVTEIPGSVITESAGETDVPEVPLDATDEVSDLPAAVEEPASTPADLPE